MPIAKNASLRSTSDFYGQLRKAIFRPISVRMGSEFTSRSWISVYLTQIATDAAKGNTRAVQEQHWYIKRLDSLGKLTASEPRREMTEIEEGEHKHEKMTEMYVRFVAILSEFARSDVRRRFEEEFGELEGFDDLLPDMFSQEFYERYLPSLKKFQRKFRPKNPDVGFGRPPLHSRFQKGQSGHPSGKRKLSNEPWGVFRDSLAALVTVTIDGVATPRPTVYVAGIQLCGRAMAGDARARRLVRDLIVMLDDKGLLTAPERPRRRRRSSLPQAQREELLRLTKAAAERCLPKVKESLSRAAAKRYGPLSDAAPPP